MKHLTLRGSTYITTLSSTALGEQTLPQSINLCRCRAAPRAKPMQLHPERSRCNCTPSEAEATAPRAKPRQLHPERSRGVMLYTTLSSTALGEQTLPQSVNLCRCRSAPRAKPMQPHPERSRRNCTPSEADATAPRAKPMQLHPERSRGNCTPSEAEATAPRAKPRGDVIYNALLDCARRADTASECKPLQM